MTIPFHVLNPRRSDRGGNLTLAKEMASGQPFTVEWLLHQSGDVGAPFEIPSGRRATVSIHGEARIAVSEDGQDWKDAHDGDGPIASGGARHIAGEHKLIRPEYIGNPKNPARSLLPGPALDAATQPVRVELLVN